MKWHEPLLRSLRKKTERMKAYKKIQQVSRQSTSKNMLLGLFYVQLVIDETWQTSRKNLVIHTLPLANLKFPY